MSWQLHNLACAYADSKVFRGQIWSIAPGDPTWLYYYDQYMERFS